MAAVAQEFWSGQSIGWRYLAQRLNADGSPGAWLDNELPLNDVQFTDQLSGPVQLTATITPELLRLIAPDGRPLLDEWRTAIYVEADGVIRAGTILVNSTKDGPNYKIDCAGFVTYAKNIPYAGQQEFRDTDPLDVVRHVWSHIQVEQGSSLGLNVDTLTTTPERIGGTATPAADDKPYTLNWWSTHDLSRVMDELAQNTPFDYHERHQWNATQTAVTHWLDFGYPMIGNRRTDLRFVLGENIQVMPAVERDGDDYANHIIVLGAGEGSAMIRAEARVEDGRLRRTTIVEAKALTSQAAAQKLARIQLSLRSQLSTITQVVVRNTRTTPLGAWAVGDEIRVIADTDWETIDLWFQVVSMTFTPDKPDIVTMSLARSGHRATLPTSVDRLAVQIAVLKNKINDLGRAPQLTNSSIDAGQLEVRDGDGQTTTIIGEQWDGTSGAVVVAGPTPPTPAAPEVTTVTGGINVRWAGSFAGGTTVVAPTDFKGVEVQVSPDPAFPAGDTADAFDLVVGTLITNARGGDVTVSWGESNTPLYARLVTRATSGKASTPSAVTGPVNSGLSSDNIAPNAPTGLSLAASTTMSKEGVEIGYIAASWIPPTTNVNGTDANDIAGYVVQWKPTAGTVWQSATSTVAAISLTAAPNQPHQVRVAAFDRNNNFSAWTATASVTSFADLTPPATPTLPTVTSYLGQLRIAWNGQLTDGAPPVDFNRVDVHVSATTGFTPSTATRVASLSAGGVAYATAPYGQTAYIRLIAYDNAGNASPATAQATGVTTQVVSADVFDGAITATKLVDEAVIAAKLGPNAVTSTKIANLAVQSAAIADGAILNAKIADLAVNTAKIVDLAVNTAKINDAAITTAKINDLAVNNAKIGNVAAGKITAGTMIADVTMAGRLIAGSSTGVGARIELNAAGLQGWRADNTTKWLSLTPTESLLTGEFKTAATGRRIEIGSVGTIGEINFIAPDNQRGFIRGYTEPDARQIESIQIGLDLGGYYLWNRININDRAEIRMDSQQINLHYGGLGAFTINTVAGAFDPTQTYVRQLTLDPGGWTFARQDGRVWMDALTNLGDTIRIAPRGVTPFHGSIEFQNNNGFADQSARLALVQEANGGTLLKSFQSALEVRTLADDNWLPARALTFTNMSDARMKSDITDATLDAEAVVKSLRVRQYKIKKSRPGGGTEDVDQIGVVAQELQAAGVPIVAAPSSDGTLGVDLAQYINVLALALQRALTRLDTLDKKGKPA